MILQIIFELDCINSIDPLGCPTQKNNWLLSSIPKIITEQYGSSLLTRTCLSRGNLPAISNISETVKWPTDFNVSSQKLLMSHSPIPDKNKSFLMGRIF